MTDYRVKQILFEAKWVQRSASPFGRTVENIASDQVDRLVLNAVSQELSDSVDDDLFQISAQLCRGLCEVTP